MNEYWFSIIIPLYNKEEFIQSTVESVLNQSYHRYEIIVINDGSTDKSLDVLAPFINEEKLKVVNKVNSGVSASRNLGVKEAKYEWIAFLDADDLWKESYLSEVNRMINTYPIASIIGMNYDCTVPFVNKIYKKEGYIKDYYKISIQEYLFNSSSVALRKSIFKQGFREDLSIGEDIEMWYRLAKNNIIAYCPYVLSHYRKNMRNEISRQKKSPIKLNWSYHLNFSSCKSKYEKQYLYKILAATCVISFKSKSFYDITLLVKKHGVRRVIYSIFIVIQHKIGKNKCL